MDLLSRSRIRIIYRECALHTTDPVVYINEYLLKQLLYHLAVNRQILRVSHAIALKIPYHSRLSTMSLFALSISFIFVVYVRTRLFAETVPRLFAWIAWGTSIANVRL